MRSKKSIIDFMCNHVANVRKYMLSKKTKSRKINQVQNRIQCYKICLIYQPGMKAKVNLVWLTSPNFGHLSAIGG